MLCRLGEIPGAAWEHTRGAMQIRDSSGLGSMSWEGCGGYGRSALGVWKGMFGRSED